MNNQKIMMMVIGLWFKVGQLAHKNVEAEHKLCKEYVFLLKITEKLVSEMQF